MTCSCCSSLPCTFWTLQTMQLAAPPKLTMTIRDGASTQVSLYYVDPHLQEFLVLLHCLFGTSIEGSIRVTPSRYCPRKYRTVLEVEVTRCPGLARVLQLRSKINSFGCTYTSTTWCPYPHIWCYKHGPNAILLSRWIRCHVCAHLFACDQ